MSFSGAFLSSLMSSPLIMLSGTCSPLFRNDWARWPNSRRFQIIISEIPERFIPLQFSFYNKIWRMIHLKFFFANFPNLFPFECGREWCHRHWSIRTGRTPWRSTCRSCSCPSPPVPSTTLGTFHDENNDDFWKIRISSVKIKDLQNSAKRRKNHVNFHWYILEINES